MGPVRLKIRQRNSILPDDQIIYDSRRENSTDISRNNEKANSNNGNRSNNGSTNTKAFYNGKIATASAIDAFLEKNHDDNPSFNQRQSFFHTSPDDITEVFSTKDQVIDQNTIMNSNTARFLSADKSESNSLLGNDVQKQQPPLPFTQNSLKLLENQHQKPSHLTSERETLSTQVSSLSKQRTLQNQKPTTTLLTAQKQQQQQQQQQQRKQQIIVPISGSLGRERQPVKRSVTPSQYGKQSATIHSTPTGKGKSAANVSANATGVTSGTKSVRLQGNQIKPPPSSIKKPNTSFSTTTTTTTNTSTISGDHSSKRTGNVVSSRFNIFPSIFDSRKINSKEQEYLIQQLKEQLILTMETIQRKEEQIEELKEENLGKEQVIQELTDNIMDIKSFVQDFTTRKKFQVKELELNLESCKKELEEANRAAEQKEVEFLKKLSNMQDKLLIGQQLHQKKDVELQYWKWQVLTLKKQQRKLETISSSENVSPSSPDEEGGGEELESNVATFSCSSLDKELLEFFPSAIEELDELFDQLKASWEQHSKAKPKLVGNHFDRGKQLQENQKDNETKKEERRNINEYKEGEEDDDDDKWFQEDS